MAQVKPPVAATSRVQSMRSRFENLTSLDALDIDRPIPARRPDRLNLPAAASAPTFRRSVTSFELLKPKNCNNNVLTTKPKVTAAKPTLARQKEVKTMGNPNPMQKSSLFKVATNRRLEAVAATGAPLSEITENVQSGASTDGSSKLSRHTSDPIKRGSIKRSPAFRVGGGVNEKPVRPKLSSPIPPNDEEQQQRPYQVGITDTLKAALRQPLPTGPPPKKPPRAFSTESTPSPQENLSTLQMFSNVSAAEPLKYPSIRANINRMSVDVVAKPSLFGGCIPCVSAAPIYDAVKLYSDEEEVLKKPLITFSNPSEHIYMEPYGHLKMLPLGGGGGSLNRNGTNEKMMDVELNGNDHKCNDSFGKMCACPAADHSADSSDLHYLVSLMSIIFLLENHLKKNDQEIMLFNRRWSVLFLIVKLCIFWKRNF